jgi:hypothetical protein
MPFMTKKMGNTGTGDAGGCAESLELSRTINRTLGVIRQDMEALPDEIMRRLPEVPEYPVVEIPPFPEIPPIPEYPEFPDIPDYSQALEVLEAKLDSLIYSQPKDSHRLEKIFAVVNFILLLLLTLFFTGMLPL